MLLHAVVLETMLSDTQACLRLDEASVDVYCLITASIGTRFFNRPRTSAARQGPRMLTEAAVRLMAPFEM